MRSPFCNMPYNRSQNRMKSAEDASDRTNINSNIEELARLLGRQAGLSWITNAANETSGGNPS